MLDIIEKLLVTNLVINLGYGFINDICVFNDADCFIVFVGIACWNPAFDVTPAELITGGIVTEFGVFTPDQLKDSLLQALAK